MPVFSAFKMLLSSRPWTMGGAGAIPLSEMLAWLDWQNIHGDDADDWLYLWQAMDAAYLDEINPREKPR